MVNKANDLSDKEKTSLAFDKQLWRKFKAKCQMEGRKYTETIEELMKKWIK